MISVNVCIQVAMIVEGWIYYFYCVHCRPQFLLIACLVNLIQQIIRCHSSLCTIVCFHKLLPTPRCSWSPTLTKQILTESGIDQGVNVCKQQSNYDYVFVGVLASMTVLNVKDFG